ncbi:MAG: hypothetical protein C4524_04570 [Candidatus Zixiibacteriota bacterium]|nr:MAG: hypothetical protein C4524_04570 [candidate division Zixibacteria bacterium]
MKHPSKFLRTGSLWWVTLFYLGICLAPAGDPPLAQESQKGRFFPLQSSPQQSQQPMEGPLQQILREHLPVAGQPLEGCIDPQTYLMGPGDLVGVHIMGDLDSELLSRVTADGTLRIATIGVFNVRERTFAQVREEILESARRSYQAGEIAVYLVELRSFKASVGGMVWTPGTYTLTATDRAVSLLALAGGFYDSRQVREDSSPGEVPAEFEREVKDDELTAPTGYSTRRAELHHLDGTRDPVDLLLFLRAGRPEGNPYLRDGDFLLIPARDPRAGILGIYGAIHHQGEVEFLPGDNLETALLLAGGLTASAQRDSVEITRFTDATTFVTRYVHLDDPGILQMPLEPDDRVYIRTQTDYHLRHNVEVRGEVAKPGFYPVSPQGTPLADVIRLAGGFTPRASLKEATVTRRFGQDEVDSEYERLRTLQANQMSKLEYAYFRNKSLELKGRVAVDLHRLYQEGDTTQNVLLRDQDIVDVPLATRTVTVSGQVNDPGILNYEPGQPPSYYIEKSGGYSWNAHRGRTRVIKAVSGRWLKPSKTLIEEGDTIFIPEKPETSPWTTTKDILLVMTQVATVFLIISNVSE